MNRGERVQGSPPSLFRLKVGGGQEGEERGKVSGSVGELRNREGI